MAIARLGAIVAGIAGSLGEVTFANARGALVLRKRQWPPNHHTAPVTARKHLYSQIWIAWRALTDAQRAAWRTAAANLTITGRLGQTRPRVPWRVFFELNNRNVATGLTIVTETSGLFNTTPDTPLKLTAYQHGPIRLSGLDLAFVNTYFQTRAARSLDYTPPKQWRNWKPITEPFSTLRYQVTLTDQFSAACGTPQASEYIALRTTLFQSGVLHARKYITETQVIPAGPEQVSTSGFEPPWNPATPTPWVKSGTYDLAAESDDVGSDVKSLKMTIPATAGIKYLYQLSTINVTSGKNYRLQFDAKVLSGTLYRIFLHTAGTGYWTPFTDLSPADWTHYEYTWTPIANGSNGDIYISTPAATAATYLLDNISFREIL